MINAASIAALSAMLHAEVGLLFIQSKYCIRNISMKSMPISITAIFAAAPGLTVSFIDFIKPKSKTAVINPELTALAIYAAIS